jgi:hypothetical protein
MERRLDKTVLKRGLRAHYPWLDRTEIGPRAVEAGECDRCGHEARMVATCGPSPHHYLGRRCAAQIGVDAWCAGHADEADEYLRWLADLPDEADDVARLWWIVTGEVRLDAGLVARHSGVADVIAGVLDDPDRASEV